MTNEREHILTVLDAIERQLYEDGNDSCSAVYDHLREVKNYIKNIRNVK